MNRTPHRVVMLRRDPETAPTWLLGTIIIGGTLLAGAFIGTCIFVANAPPDFFYAWQL